MTAVAALALFKRLWWAIPIALLLAWGLRVDHLRAGYKQSLADTKAAYKKAQDDAQADFDLKIAAEKARNLKVNEDADKKAADSAIVYRDRVIRLPAAPTCGSPGGAGVPKADIPGGVAGPDSSAFVSIKRDDAMICSITQSRLEAARAWALEMQGN